MIDIDYSYICEENDCGRKFKEYDELIAHYKRRHIKLFEKNTKNTIFNDIQEKLNLITLYDEFEKLDKSNFEIKEADEEAEDDESEQLINIKENEFICENNEENIKLEISDNISFTKSVSIPDSIRIITEDIIKGDKKDLFDVEEVFCYLFLKLNRLI